MIQHHPAETTLLAYAAGTLPILHQEVVKVHLSQCATCRQTMRQGQELGGALLDDEQPARMAEDAFAQTLARLDEPEKAEKATTASLDALIRHGRWKWLGYGIRLMPLVARDGTGTRLDLVRVAPGISLPQHDHTGHEMTCVLQGGYADKDGDYHAGDLTEGDVGLNHQPRAFDDGECICLIATTGLLRADSLIVRLLQPVFGI